MVRPQMLGQLTTTPLTETEQVSWLLPISQKEQSPFHSGVSGIVMTDLLSEQL